MTTQERAGGEKAEAARGQSPAQEAEPTPETDAVAITRYTARGASVLRAGDVLALQRMVGNRATAELLGVQRQGAAAPAAAAAPNIVSLSLNMPAAIVDTSRPAAEIGAGHGWPGSAGWCTSNELVLDTLKVWKPEEDEKDKPPTIEVRLSLSWTIEMPTDADFRPGTANYAILLNHEQGHRTREMKLAETMLKQDLRARLAGLAEPDEGKARAMLVEAQKQFSAARLTMTNDYHATSYPRMKAAYKRAKMSLPQLMADWPEFAQLVTGMRTLNAALARVPASMPEPHRLDFDDAGAAHYGQAIIAAISGLHEEDMPVVQRQGEVASLASVASQGCERYLSLFNDPERAPEHGPFREIALDLVGALSRL